VLIRYQRMRCGAAKIQTITISNFKPWLTAAMDRSGRDVTDG